ncbi:MAG: AmmeMemoRadiSam system radical SAM enzyme [Chitinivibrionia bacterium]|nr:AmmeMemoRadiSam system radical SAM enzyme [Chitinivibrionia bacterium]
MKLTRRDFLQASGASCIALAASGLPAPAADPQLVEARYYEKLPDKKIKCVLCPRECAIDNRETGYCGVRENREGAYYTLVYGKPCTINIDPIEKKPHFHFHPGTAAFSTATAGCNINCKFCQNWEISQSRPEQIRYYDLSPEEFVAECVKHGVPTIAYTYSEPVVFTEYMHDISAEARKRGIKNVMITNGYIQEKPMRDLTGVLDAVKIDLKSFRERYYRDVCDGELKPVLDTLLLLSSLSIWIEIVYLVVPTLNDGADELKELSAWCLQNLGGDVPMHFTRFQPQYRLKNLPPTPTATLEKAKKIYEDAGGKYVYIGNVPGHEAENTSCPACGELLIKRRMYDVQMISLRKGRCAKCNEAIPGVWNEAD